MYLLINPIYTEPYFKGLYRSMSLKFSELVETLYFSSLRTKSTECFIEITTVSVTTVSSHPSLTHLNKIFCTLILALLNFNFVL